MMQITARVSDGLVAALDETAERFGRTRAAVMRVAIERFVNDVAASGDEGAEARTTDGRAAGVPDNPYARTRPTPVEDREENLHERRVSRARQREQRLLAAFGPVYPPGTEPESLAEFRKRLRGSYPEEW